MTPKPPNARSRALDLAVPVASCVAAGIGTAHLLAPLSREELAALVDVLALAASPVAVRDLVRNPEGWRRRDPEARVRMTRAAHAQAEACRKDGRPVPPHLAALERAYWRDRKQAQRDVAAGQMALLPAREPEPCPSLAAYRRHKAAGEPHEDCGCSDAARAARRAKARRRAAATEDDRAVA